MTSGRQKEPPAEDRFIAKGKVRFAVGPHGGRYSTPWFAKAHGETLYIGSRKISGSIKVSLHHPTVDRPGGNLPGGYRLAFTDDFYDRLVEQGTAPVENRAVVYLPNPEAPVTGILLITSLFFPTDFLASTAPPSKASEPYFLLEAAKPGWTVQVGFFLSREPLEVLEETFLAQLQNPICRWDFDNGTNISMAFWERPFDAASVLPSRPGKSTQLTKGALEFREGERRENLTGLLWNKPTLGEALQIVEVGGVAVERSTAVSNTNAG